MDNNRAAIIAAAIAFIIGVLFGYNLHGRNIKEKTLEGRPAAQAYTEASPIEKENIILKQQLQKAARDNEILNNQIVSLKAQIAGENLEPTEDCKTSLEEMERRTSELEKENREAAQLLNRIRSLISREKE